MKTLHSLQDLSVTKEIVLAEAERALMARFTAKRLRTAWQLRRTVAG